MKNILSFLALAVFVAGCTTQNPTGTRAIVTIIVRDGATFGISRSPAAVPYLKAAAPVVCAVANSTNLTPESLVAALDGIPVAKSPEAGLIIDGVVAVYDGYFEQYADNWVKNQATLQSVLLGCCDGLNQALAPPPMAARTRKWQPVHTK
jgi:hypothetical protein